MAAMIAGPARGKIREMNGIEGSPMNDCLIMCCSCTSACALCQVLVEKHVRALNGAQCSTVRARHSSVACFLTADT